MNPNLIQVNADDYAALRADDRRLREKLLEIANTCEPCEGTGTLRNYGHRACDRCTSIRELLSDVPALISRSGMA